MASEQAHRNNPFQVFRKDLIAPCRDCGERYPGCADHCQREDYIQYLAARETKHLFKAAESSKLENIAQDWKHRRRK